MSVTNEQIEQMTKGELRTALKARKLKYSKLSVMQQKELLKDHKDAPAPKVKAKKPLFRPGSKAEKCYNLLLDNKGMEVADLLALFVKKGGLTNVLAARTYYYNIQKRIK